MRSGRLNNKVTVQRLVGTLGGAGAVLDSWQDVVTRRASVRPMTGREILTGDLQIGDVTHTVILRKDDHLAGITPRDRLKVGTRFFDIVSVMDWTDERARNTEITLKCRERV